MSDVSQGLVSARAVCQDCDWYVESKNAQGVGAQHADKYDHEVRGELVYAYTARPEGSQ